MEIKGRIQLHLDGKLVYTSPNFMGAGGRDRMSDVLFSSNAAFKLLPTLESFVMVADPNVPAPGYGYNALLDDLLTPNVTPVAASQATTNQTGDTLRLVGTYTAPGTVTIYQVQVGMTDATLIAEHWIVPPGGSIFTGGIAMTIGQTLQITWDFVVGA